MPPHEDRHIARGVAERAVFDLLAALGADGNDDYLRETPWRMIESDEFATLVRDRRVSGVTSNPTIFANATSQLVTELEVDTPLAMLRLVGRRRSSRVDDRGGDSGLRVSADRRAPCSIETALAWRAVKRRPRFVSLVCIATGATDGRRARAA